MNMVNYKLPECVILDGESHQGNTLKGRTVIQHVRSYTVLEVVAMDYGTLNCSKQDVIMMAFHTEILPDDGDEPSSACRIGVKGSDDRRLATKADK